MLRRLHPEQPESFAWTPANEDWARAQLTRYPEGRQASAVIPLLWRAQEQEGWLTRPAIEHVAAMLGMAKIRVLEVATFYFMFQLQPVGSVAHVQVCGTTSCMICGAEDLMQVCREKIAKAPHQISEDGRFSWEEVECLGACANAPMAQIGKDYYEDLDRDSFAALLDELAAGKTPRPGSRKGRFASEPAGGRTSLLAEPSEAANGSVALADALGDGIKRIDGTEAPIRTYTASPLQGAPLAPAGLEEAPAPFEPAPAPGPEALGTKPSTLDGARDGQPDDLKRIRGIGPKLEVLCHELGFYHFDQIAAWTDAEVAWVDRHLESFKGRVTRDDWVTQAKEILAQDG